MSTSTQKHIEMLSCRVAIVPILGKGYLSIVWQLAHHAPIRLKISRFLGADDNDTFCRKIPYSAIYKDLNYENIDGKLYEVNCSNRNEATLLEQCGKKNEGTSLESCKKYSNGVNSCCYIKGNNEISRGCYWLGTKYEGKTTWAGVEMECNMSFLKYSLFYLNFIFYVLF